MAFDDEGAKSSPKITSVVIAGVIATQMSSSYDDGTSQMIRDSVRDF